MLGPCESLAKAQKQNRIEKKLKQKYQPSFSPDLLFCALPGSFSILFSTLNTKFAVKSLVGLKLHSVHKAFSNLPATQ